jgi:HEPN domain-containing protein
LKAILQSKNVHIPKIHHLLELLGLILKLDSSFELLRADLDFLDAYAVRFRYPGDFAEKDQAKSALESVKVVREFIRRKLSLK